METRFNVFEILQIAERVEHNGAKFYLKTAELLDDPEVWLPGKPGTRRFLHRGENALPKRPASSGLSILTIMSCQILT
jgi:hypothetical protein